MIYSVYDPCENYIHVSYPNDLASALTKPTTRFVTGMMSPTDRPSFSLLIAPDQAKKKNNLFKKKEPHEANCYSWFN